MTVENALITAACVMSAVSRVLSVWPAHLSIHLQKELVKYHQRVRFQWFVAAWSDSPLFFSSQNLFTRTTSLSNMSLTSRTYEHSYVTSWDICSSSFQFSKSTDEKDIFFLFPLRLMSWWMTLCECRYSRPRRTCLATQMISNSLMGPQLSNFSRTEPPSPASMKRWTLWSHSTAPYSSAMLSCRKRAWNSTSAALKFSNGICEEDKHHMFQK